MQDLFGFLLLISLILLVLGLIKPSLVLRWGAVRSRKRVLCYFVPSTFLFFMLFGATEDVAKRDISTTTDQTAKKSKPHVSKSKMKRTKNLLFDSAMKREAKLVSRGVVPSLVDITADDIIKQLRKKYSVSIDETWGNSQFARGYDVVEDVYTRISGLMDADPDAAVRYWWFNQEGLPLRQLFPFDAGLSMEAREISDELIKHGVIKWYVNKYGGLPPENEDKQNDELMWKFTAFYFPDIVRGGWIWLQNDPVEATVLELKRVFSVDVDKEAVSHLYKEAYSATQNAYDKISKFINCDPGATVFAWQWYITFTACPPEGNLDLDERIRREVISIGIDKWLRDKYGKNLPKIVKKFRFHDEHTQEGQAYKRIEEIYEPSRRMHKIPLFPQLNVSVKRRGERVR